MAKHMYGLAGIGLLECIAVVAFGLPPVASERFHDTSIIKPSSSTKDSKSRVSSKNDVVSFATVGNSDQRSVLPSACLNPDESFVCSL